MEMIKNVMLFGIILFLTLMMNAEMKRSPAFQKAKSKK